MDDLNDRIVPLNDLDDFKVASGDPDVRGWEVFGADGRRLGDVDQLLVDTRARKVRYLDVDLDDALLAGGEDRHALIPIGYARLDERADRVVVDGLSAQRVSELPAYRHQPVTRDFEVLVARTCDPGDAGRSDDLYSHSRYDDDRFFAGRRARGEA